MAEPNAQSPAPVPLVTPSTPAAARREASAASAERAFPRRLREACRCRLRLAAGCQRNHRPDLGVDAYRPGAICAGCAPRARLPVARRAAARRRKLRRAVGSAAQPEPDQHARHRPPLAGVHAARHRGHCHDGHRVARRRARCRRRAASGRRARCRRAPLDDARRGRAAAPRAGRPAGAPAFRHARHDGPRVEDRDRDGARRVPRRARGSGLLACPRTASARTARRSRRAVRTAT